MADRQLDVLVICGSLRKGSYNAALARTLPALAPPGLKLRTAPPFDKLPIYNHDIQDTTGFPAEANAWADAIRSADAVIIVSPEYNWSIPGGLKNAIDWVSRVRERGDPTYAAFKGRAFAIASASPGRAGGLRSLMALRQILELGCGALVIPEQLAIPRADTAFDDMDNIADAGVANLFRVQLERLVEMSRLMAKGA